MYPEPGDTVTLDFDDNSVIRAVIEDTVFADATIGQWDKGWIAYNPNSKPVNDYDFEMEWFVSQEGVVYKLGCSTAIGQCLEIRNQFEQYLEAQLRSELRFDANLEASYLMDE